MATLVKRGGFPNPKRWVKEMRFERLGCFTYSHEENTHAYCLEDDVVHEIKQERANEIMKIQSESLGNLIKKKLGKFIVAS